MAVTVAPSPKFHEYVHVSPRSEPLFGSELVSVRVTVKPLELGVNDATGE